MKVSAKKTLTFEVPVMLKKLFSYPGSRTLSWDFTLCTIFGIMPGFEPELLRPVFLNRKLCCVCDACARPNSQNFWNWIPKNIPDRQKCVAFRKLQKSANSLNPTEQYTSIATHAWQSFHFFNHRDLKIII